MHVVGLRVCVHAYETLRLDFPSELLKTASGGLDTFLRKGRRQGAITLLAVRYFPFPPLLPPPTPPSPPHPRCSSPALKT